MQIRKVVKHLSQENTAKADILQKRIVQDPLNPHLYIELGGVYEQDQIFNDALVEYQKALALDPAYYEALERIGVLNYRRGDYAESVKYLKRALLENPDSLSVKRYLLNAYVKTGELEAATTLGESILIAEPENFEIRRQLADLYRDRTDNEHCLQHLSKLIELRPADPTLLADIIRFAIDTDNVYEAEKYYSRLGPSDPKVISLALGLARLYCIVGEYSKCISTILPISTYETGEDEHLAKLLLAYSGNKMGKGVEEYEQDINAVSMLKDRLSDREKMMYFGLLSELGRYYHTAGKPEKAVQYLEKAVETLPGSPQETALLNQLKSGLHKSRYRRRRKITLGLAATGVMATLVIAGWQLSHGTMMINYEGEGIPKLYIDDDTVENYKLLRGGLLETPSMFLGTYKVALERDGYERWEEMITLRFGDTVSIRAHNKPGYGALVVQTTPGDCKVYLDNVLLGETGRLYDSVRSGNHSLRVDKGYFRSESQEVVIAIRETTRLVLRLEREKAKIRISGHVPKWGWRTPEAIKVNDDIQHVTPQGEAREFEVEAGIPLNIYVRFRTGTTGDDVEKWQWMGVFVLRPNEYKTIVLTELDAAK